MLCLGDFGDGSEEQVNSMRVILVLAEQVYCSWLGCFTRDALKRFTASATLSPWKEFSISGTNWSQPILQAAHVSKGKSTITPEEKKERQVDLKWLRRFQESVERKKARVYHDRVYQLLVTQPVEKMRREKGPNKRPEKEIKEWQKAVKEVWADRLAPSPSKIKFETHTARPEADIAREIQARAEFLEKEAAKKASLTEKEEAALQKRRDFSKENVRKRKLELEEDEA